MQTIEKIGHNRGNVLPAGCALPQLKSLLIEQATRRAGRTLYEILGMAELMRVAYEKGELESLEQRLAMLLSDAADLSARLANILELARLETETSEPEFKEFDVVALLNEVAQTARIVVGEKPVMVMDAASLSRIVICSDPHKIRQIMTELMNNAAKFTDRGRIALIVNKDEDSLRLMITDTGRGMSAEEITAFVHSDNYEFDGETGSDVRSGLGLKIVRHLVRSFDGKISISSRIGEGTIVEVMLPVTQRRPTWCS